jgi:hypothetical protein
MALAEIGGPSTEAENDSDFRTYRQFHARILASSGGARAKGDLSLCCSDEFLTASRYTQCSQESVADQGIDA